MIYLFPEAPNREKNTVALEGALEENRHKRRGAGILKYLLLHVAAHWHRSNPRVRQFKHTAGGDSQVPLELC